MLALYSDGTAFDHAIGGSRPPERGRGLKVTHTQRARSWGGTFTGTESSLSCLLCWRRGAAQAGHFPHHGLRFALAGIAVQFLERAIGVRAKTRFG